MSSYKFVCRSSDSIACLQKLDLMENKSEKLKQEVNEILSFVKVNICLENGRYDSIYPYACTGPM